MSWIIYCHIHTETGRRYVGLTSRTWQERWRGHLCSARKGQVKTHFANAIRLYGKHAFSHEVLEVCETIEEANAAEELWIGKLDTRNPEKGFNLAKGGQHIPHPVKNPWERPEYREKATLASRRTWSDPERRARVSAERIGGKLSDYHRSRISETMTGKKRSPEMNEKITSSLKVVMARPDVRSKLSAASKRSWADPEVARRRSETIKEGMRLSKERRLASQR